MWGSTTPNTADECTWSNAPFNNGSNSCDEEYFNAHKSEWLDSKNNLKSEFDAASQIMGGDWRMPTEAEFNELLDKTDNKWVDNFNNSGVNGWKFTSKTDTSKYIFIPAAGYYYDGNVASGDDGAVWSSSLYTSSPSNACGFSFFIDREYDDIYHYMSNQNRYQGWSVRGVRK